MAVVANDVDFSLPPWGEAVAGAAGAILANALVYPLDLIKTKLQTQTKCVRQPTSSVVALASRQTNLTELHYSSTWDALKGIYDYEGISGLYAGMPGSLLGVASTNLAYFYWYALIRSAYTAHLQRHEHVHNHQTHCKAEPVVFASTVIAATPAATTAAISNPLPISISAELGLGTVSGALAQVFTLPVAVVTTRQQTTSLSERKDLVGTAREVIHGPDGWTGLWKGLKASLVLVVNPSITYGTYQQLRRTLYSERKTLGPSDAFYLGALSKSLATVLTQPLIVAKLGLQSNPPPERKGRPFSSFAQVMEHIVRHEGVLRLFKGLGPQLLKGLLVQGLLMMMKER